ncbi:hypothetical protein ACLB2K_050019 [Fragaria x ananassa]
MACSWSSRSQAGESSSYAELKNLKTKLVGLWLVIQLKRMKAVAQIHESCFFLIVIFLVLFHTTFVDDFIQQSCKKAADRERSLNYTFCVSTLEADPKSHGADLYGLANITLYLAGTKVINITAQTQELKKDPKVDQPALQDCEELYEDAPDSMQEAIDSFKEKDYEAALNPLSAALNAPDTCETGFQERKAVSPLKKEDDDFTQLGVISLTFIGLLSGKQ